MAYIERYMPYTKTVNENVTHYTVTTPNWYCEWIVDRITIKKPIKRQCHLNDSILDPLNAEDRIRIHDILPEILNEIDTAVYAWTQAGDVIASTLLYPENIPAYLAYAKNALT